MEEDDEMHAQYTHMDTYSYALTMGVTCFSSSSYGVRNERNS